MNHFVYHILFHEIEGSKLYPINYLKEHLPNLYIKSHSKYKNRSYVPDYEIPTLKCKWGNIIHFTFIEPKILLQELKNAGEQNDITLKYIQVPISYFHDTNSVIYLNQKDHRLTKKLILMSILL